MKRNKFKAQTYLQVQCKKSETNKKKRKNYKWVSNKCVCINHVNKNKLIIKL